MSVPRIASGKAAAIAAKQGSRNLFNQLSRPAISQLSRPAIDSAVKAVTSSAPSSNLLNQLSSPAIKQLSSSAIDSAVKAVTSSAPTAKSVSYAPSVSSGVTVSTGDGGVSVAAPDYLYADLAKAYGMDATTAYQEALSNTSYRRAMADLKAAGINPILAVTGLSGASGVSYARPIEQASSVATVSEPSGGFSTGTTSGKSVHTWYKRLTNIGTIVGAAFGHPIIGSSVGSAIGNLIDLAAGKD